jgi:hypothetical protein
MRPGNSGNPVIVTSISHGLAFPRFACFRMVALVSWCLDARNPLPESLQTTHGYIGGCGDRFQCDEVMQSSVPSRTLVSGCRKQ